MRIFETYLSATLVFASLGLSTAAAPKIIAVQVVGHGEPVIFIPGVATSGAVWDGTVQHLQDRYECHVITIAGFGGMAPAKTAHLLEDVRDQIITYIRSQKLHKPTIVGHSLGGAIALAIGEHAPDLPGDIVSVDGLPFIAGMRFPGVNDTATAREAVAAIRDSIEKQAVEQFTARRDVNSSLSHIRSEYDRRIAQVCGQSDAATVAQARVEMFSADFRPQLGRIKCPILVLGALAGKLQNVPPRMLEETYKKLYTNAPQTRFEFFPKARHYLMIDDPAGFYAALDQELAAPRGIR